MCATAQLLVRSSVIFLCYHWSSLDVGFTFKTPFTHFVLSTFLVIANVSFAVALSRIDQSS